jgi:hypothetical protein
LKKAESKVEVPEERQYGHAAPEANEGNLHNY